MANARPFVMHGAREIIEFSGGAVHIEQQIRALENAVAESPNLAFDLSRSLVESVCKTILGDRGNGDCDSLGFKDLLKKTYGEVKRVPDSHAAKTDVVDSINKVLENLDNVIFGLTSLRHAEGLASHGKDGYTLSLESIQAQLSARAADTVVHFLFMAHKNYPDIPRSRVLSLSDNPDFNEFVDENSDPVHVLDLIYPPSEVLFSVDEEAYRDKLAAYRSDQESLPDAEGEEVGSDSQ